MRRRGGRGRGRCLGGLLTGRGGVVPKQRDNARVGQIAWTKLHVLTQQSRVHYPGGKKSALLTGPYV